MTEESILTDAQCKRMHKYAETFIRQMSGSQLNWIMDDLKQDFCEKVITLMLKGKDFDLAMWYARFYIIDMLRGRRYFYTSRKAGTESGRCYRHDRFTQMDPETWEEFYAIYSYCPEPSYIDGLMSERFLEMMDGTARRSWELWMEGWTQKKIAEIYGVDRSTISTWLTRGVKQVREELEMANDLA